MIIHYDSTVDALDIRLLPDAEVTQSLTIDDRRVVDLDESGRVVSIEVTGASHGFQVSDLIARFALMEHERDLLEIAEGRLLVGHS